MKTNRRHLVVVLGDQLDRDAAAFDGFDPAQDLVWMCEAVEESTHVWSSQQRIVMFLSAMRHFAAALRADGVPLHYESLREGSLADALREAIAQARPQRVRLTQPGDWRVLQALRQAAGPTPLDVLEDRHFLCNTARFASHARGRRQLRMEHFYREMRRRHGLLMEGDQPCGGAWNFDADNRAPFGPDGPGFLPPPTRFDPDASTQAVIALVQARFAGHPGQAAPFGWPVTRAQALEALRVFVDERLAPFGRWQDAMWTGEPWLYHAHLSAALNLKLLNPREVIAAAEAAWRAGRVPLASAEGFIRQILGWREYVRGIYWLQMPDYARRNAFGNDRPLPEFYWTGRTRMNCIRQVIGQTLELAYAHHIQRLMVTGNFALLAGIAPPALCDWYLAVYADACEWVELPNTLGMVLHADGGYLGSKPYCASGQYIKRMSDYCQGCSYSVAESTTENACPFNALYWHFLMRHRDGLEGNHRLRMPYRNLERMDADKRDALWAQAEGFLAKLDRGM